MTNDNDIQQMDVEIKSASLGDALCSYSYELLTGKTAGDVLNRKGNHIVHEDLEKAFSNFNVFFAHLDDAYTGNDNSTTLQTLEEDDQTQKYNVSAFKISGVEENRSLILSATKYVTHGVVKFDSPKVKLSGNYLYLSDIQDALQNALSEVEQYMNGKSAPQMEQATIEFPPAVVGVGSESFEAAKVED